MNTAITIDNRQFEKRQERQGKKGTPFTSSYPKANYSRKRQYPSISYRQYRGPIDVDTNQKDSYLYDKSDITYFNYSKKGYFKQEYYSPKKNRQRPTLYKEVTTVEKGAKVVEVSANEAYNQDNLKDAIDYESQYIREDSEGNKGIVLE